jgi:methionine sulfoxide reductase heme-binding subunit
VSTLALTDPSKYLFWITTRAAGTAALVLASLSVGLGLAMATGVLKRWGADRRVVHEVLSLSVLAAIAVHALSLLADSYLHASVIDVTVPFVFSYKTLPTSIGIIAGWGLVFLGLSYYARRRIGQRRWRSLHRFTALVWILGLVHAFTEGSDSGQLWFIVLITISAAPAAILLLIRYLEEDEPAGGKAAPRPARPQRERAPHEREPPLAEQYG